MRCRAELFARDIYVAETQSCACQARALPCFKRLVGTTGEEANSFIGGRQLNVPMTHLFGFQIQDVIETVSAGIGRVAVPKPVETFLYGRPSARFIASFRFQSGQHHEAAQIKARIVPISSNPESRFRAVFGGPQITLNVKADGLFNKSLYPQPCVAALHRPGKQFRRLGLTFLWERFELQGINLFEFCRPYARIASGLLKPVHGLGRMSIGRFVESGAVIF